MILKPFQDAELCDLISISEEKVKPNEMKISGESREYIFLRSVFWKDLVLFYNEQQRICF